MTPRKLFVWTQQGSCTNELIVIMTACTRPTQAPRTWSPTVTELSVEELLVTEGCWEKDNEISLRT